MEPNKITYISVSPVGNGKRVLLFLADFFLCFILSLVLFSLACYPISKTFPAVKEAARIEEEGQEEKRNLLFSSALLSKKPERKNSDLSSIREYSSTLFLLGQLDGSGENDYFKRYYLDRKGKDRNYLRDVYAHTSTNIFFESDGKERVRKQKYQEEFSPLLDDKDERTSQGKNDLTYFKNSFFALRYGNRLKDREKEENQGEFFSAFRLADGKRKKGKQSFTLSVVVSSFVSYFLSCLILFLFVPLFNRKRKTLGNRARKCVRVNRYGFLPPSSLKLGCLFLLSLLFSLPCLLFIPCFYVSFTELFSFYQLLSFSLAGLGLDLVSLVYLLCNGFGRSLSDYLSARVRIGNDEYEKLPRSKQK